MRLGVSLDQVGRLADPASVRSAAVSAEQVGFSSLWVLDHLLPPAEPRNPCGHAPGAELPAERATALDPLSVLAYAAAVTSRVQLGTSVLVAPWYRPALLARSLTSLDVLSDRRLTVGLGLGWSLDEYEAAGVPQRELGRRLDEALDVLGAVWGGDPMAPRSRDEHPVPMTDPKRGPTDPSPERGGPPSWTGHRPVRRPRPPVLLAAYTPEGLDRVARRADGWNPAGVPIEMLAPLWAGVLDQASGYGRDPDALELVVRANIVLTDRPVDGDRAAYSGTIEQVAADVDATRRAGAHEIILGLYGDHGLSEALEHYAGIAEALDVTAPA
jgi:alkanesulfonate monooxygenase SsuD/methylene tetrahydromethanopterin reductase-like flavin-dependent oxidoreductase (luciferase family)